MKKTYIKILPFIVGLLWVTAGFSQDEPEDIAAVTDDFQNSFYESLKQKGIENYDKAIQALEKCIKIQPNNAVVLYEMGKNYLSQKKYDNALESFEKASKIEPKNKWYWGGIYDVNYKRQDYTKAIESVQKLIQFDDNFKDDLVSLYMNTKQYDKALSLINELNDTKGKSEIRDIFKAQILTNGKFQGTEITNLEEQINKNPKEEENYVALIKLYINSNQEDKIVEIAKRLEATVPNSDWAQVSLFKTHLNEKNPEKAIQSMHKVLGSSRVDSKIKHRVLNEFLLFVKNNPTYTKDLESALVYFKDDKEVKVAKEIGKFYQNKKDWDNAIKFYELDAQTNKEDLETAFLLLESYSQKAQYETLAKKATIMIELYPLQPQFYYYAGLANNQLKNYKKAKEILETGIDYVVDNKQLEINFNIQLGESYNGLGDVKKKEVYFLKADTLLKSKK
jgi:tetratricopeptide (TPR) repeat protein